MKTNTKIAVIVPCYRVRDHILDVCESMPEWVDYIVLVDDACPERTGKFAKERLEDSRCRIIVHPKNLGVGGAMKSGYREALKTDATIFIKIDGDGQMDASELEALIQPLISGSADFAKGNRFYDVKAFYQMPFGRRLGNLGLTLLAKFATGYWDVSDPTNGYVAIHRSALELLDIHKMDNGYFFECKQLVELNIIRAVIAEIPMPAKYGNESSSLSIRKTLLVFPFKLMRAFTRRIVWRYFVYSMGATTIFLSLGGILFTGSLVFGLHRWYLGAFGDHAQSAGTVALGLFPAIIGFQMLLQAMILDILEKPSQPIQTKWKHAFDPDR